MSSPLNDCKVKCTYKLRIFFVFLILCLPSLSFGDMVSAHKYLGKKKYSAAEKTLLSSAKLGNAEAQFKLGVLYGQGKLGEKNNSDSIAWLSLAAEQDYPDAMVLAMQVMNSLEHSQKILALSRFDELEARFGKKELETVLFPTYQVANKQQSVIASNAKVVKKGKISYDALGVYLQNQSPLIQAVNRGTSKQFSENVRAALANQQDPPSGRVIVTYDIDINGKARDIEVIFSYPSGFFDRVSRNQLLTSVYSPALTSTGQPVRQNGMVQQFIFGLYDAYKLDVQYPNNYQKFRTYRRQSKDGDLMATYAYSAMLRAYKSILKDKDKHNFLEPLQTAAESGLYAAQYDLAMHHLYMNYEDREKGMYWLKKAASAGHAAAQYHLAKILINPADLDFSFDRDKAKVWFKLAALKSHVLAVENYASLVVEDGHSDEVKALLEIFNGIKKSDNRSAKSYALNAKAELLEGSKRKAKKYFKKAIAVAKSYKADTAEWEAALQSI